MIFKIITTQRVMEYLVDWVELNTPVGNMIVQEGHAPMIIELRAGHELVYQITDGALQSILIVQGVAHVTRNEIKILLPIDL